MKKRVVRIWDVPAGGLFPALLVVSAAFVLGGLLGCLMAAQVDGGGTDSLNAYLQSYLSAAQSGAVSKPGLLPVLWETLRWPVLTFFMSFTALGVLGIPVLFSIRGFLLSFAVSSFVRMFGGAGGILAFFAFGLTGLVAVPVLFVLGVQGFAAARELAGRFFGGGKRSLPFGKTYFMRCGVCAAALFGCICLESFAVPALLRSVASLF